MLDSEQRNINKTGDFSFTPNSPGTYVLRAAGINNFNGDQTVHRFPWGELFEVTAQKHYTVLFETEAHGTRIGGGQLEQFVTQGEAATEPNLDVDPGWTLTGWDTDFTNVQEDLTVVAEYSDNDVLQDDWEQQIVDADPDDSVETILDVDPHDDFDDDGWSNLQEHENNTDPTRYVLELHKGWNLVSIALAPADYSVEGIFGDKIISPVWKWADGQYQEASKIKPLRGYWIYSKKEQTINIGIKLP